MKKIQLPWKLNQKIQVATKNMAVYYIYILEFKDVVFTIFLT